MERGKADTNSKGGSACSYTTRDTEKRMEKKSSVYFMTKGTRALQEEHS